MIRRKKTDSDGKCCMEIMGGCTSLTEASEYCETYRCPFYKPEGCSDWLRRDKGENVELYTPEEREGLCR